MAYHNRWVSSSGVFQKKQFVFLLISLSFQYYDIISSLTLVREKKPMEPLMIKGSKAFIFLKKVSNVFIFLFH
jgi:hypothetical protein